MTDNLSGIIISKINNYDGRKIRKFSGIIISKINNYDGRKDFRHSNNEEFYLNGRNDFMGGLE